jgi:hypothetical protein
MSREHRQCPPVLSPRMGVCRREHGICLRSSIMRQGFSVFAVALFTIGCAEQLQLLDRGPVGGISPCSFWPPPPSSATWLAEPSQSGPPVSLRTIAREVELSLHDGGYLEQRWYPIGISQSHGFAVTTRLEQLDDDIQSSAHTRWSSLYGNAANLKWLAQARTPALPHPGRYLVLFVAYTDLPIERTGHAPVWSQETIMDWPDAPVASSPGELAVPALAPDGYRLANYEYEYTWNDSEQRGKWLPPRADARSRQSPPLAASLEARGFTLLAPAQF